MAIKVYNPLEGNVFVTGGTGSLGRALLARAEREEWPCKFTIFSRDETKQGLVRKRYPQHRYVLGDVAEFPELMRVMPGHDTVMHFAAYKQVPSAQNNVFSTLKTNVLGSQNVVDAAIRCGVSNVVASSTDKACAPANAYGASKSLMETLFQNGNSLSETTRFCLARYGNVVCSNASVIPLFLDQKAKGVPLTVTHRDMTRFWITLDEAIDIILLALIVSRDQEVPCGTIVVPKAGAKSIWEVAQLIAGDVPIAVTGIRPGEKIHEAMVSGPESFYTHDKDDYFLIYPPLVSNIVHQTPWQYTSEHADTISDERMLTMIQEA